MRIKTHPGEVLREEFMAPLGLTAEALSVALHEPPANISDIVNKRRGITAEAALRLARYFGTTPDFWLRLQDAHDRSAIA